MPDNLPCLQNLSYQLTLRKDFSPGHFGFTPLPNVFALEDLCQLLLHITKIPKLVIGDVLILAVPNQTSLCKDNIRIAHRTTIRNPIPDVNDDVVLPRECQKMIALAVPAQFTLSIGEGE